MDLNKFSLSKDGFEIFNYLNESEFDFIKSFTLKTLDKLFARYATEKEILNQKILQNLDSKQVSIANVSENQNDEIKPTLTKTHFSSCFGITDNEIETYHLWGEKAKIPHKEMLQAKNRHLQPCNEIKNILVNEKLIHLLKEIGIIKFKLWDEGLGWLAFRMIRPGFGDGYPFSCKNWGPAKHVFSLWIPIIGFSRELMINLIPGSHKKNYPKYLPENTQFTKDEYRLAYEPDLQECLRPEISQGEALIFHYNTVHAEEVRNGCQTRVNLEFRIQPL